jgi:hypothetical protein
VVEVTTGLGCSDSVIAAESRQSSSSRPTFTSALPDGAMICDRPQNREPPAPPPCCLLLFDRCFYLIRKQPKQNKASNQRTCASHGPAMLALARNSPFSKALAGSTASKSTLPFGVGVVLVLVLVLVLLVF